VSVRHEHEGLKYGTAEIAKPAENLGFLDSSLEQRDPQHCPHPDDPPSPLLLPTTLPKPASLGEPLTISAVAQLLGCSPWTVRQRYLPQGLPHLRTCATGKFVFFREQVIAWIEKRQQQRQKGGMLR
jgi:hypothetical protein